MMTKKDKNILLVIGAILLLLILSKRPKAKTIEVTMDWLVGAYADLINNPGNLQYEGEPLHLYLAKSTVNYADVKFTYETLYKTNLTLDLIERLEPQQYADFVNTLWEYNQQALFE